MTALLVVAQAAHAATDSTVVESPLPGGPATVVRFLFNLPAWFQAGGAIVGVLVAIALLILIWRKRAPIGNWIVTRQRGVQYAMLAGLAIVLLAAAGFGAVSWGFMQHDNSFCSGCHIMEHPFDRFVAGAGAHDTLQCHNCHQQSIFASARQLYLWVAERPSDIPAHAKVPSSVCKGCHVTGQEETWQRIASTAGHRVHLESDSSALKDVECVTCHGLEVHRFVPVDSTCGQSGCHVSTEIKLGKMSEQTDLHCSTCHQFTAEVPALATRDSAAGTLVPTNEQCLGCHEMQKVLAEFDPVLDPHNGTCGMCHNPHTQSAPSEAAKTCTTAGCHDDWRKEPFHLGVRHRDVAQNCILCHQPHAARVDPSDCATCHERVRNKKGVRKVPPMPFDTTKALQESAAPSPAGTHVGLLPRERGKGDVLLEDGPPGAPAPVPRDAFPADTFSHQRHKSLDCLTCHVTRAGHGRLTFEPPRGCQICHHQAPARNDCSRCHTSDNLTPAHAVTVSVNVPEHEARPREVAFQHEAHADVACVDCHTTAVSLKPAAGVLTCENCHADHHQADRTCSTCHAIGNTLVSAHERPVQAHVACARCHTPSAVATLVPDRPFCLTCHADQDHYAPKQCTVCHLQATPAEWKPRLAQTQTERAP